MINKAANMAKQVFFSNKTRKISSALMVVVMVFLSIMAAVLTIPRLFGFQVFAVATGSMEPCFNVGSIVFSKKMDTDKIEVGDCITYTFEEETITHRVIDINKKDNEFITKGDKNKFEDPPVSFDRLVGKTSEFSLPVLGHFVLWVHQINFYVLFIVFAGIAVTTASIIVYSKFKRRHINETNEAKC